MTPFFRKTLYPTIFRLVWALAVLFAGCGILAYIVAAIVLPRKPQ